MNDTAIGAGNTSSNTQSGFSLPSGWGNGVGPPNPEMTPGGKKLDSGKVGVHLLPPKPLIEIAKVLDFGAKKYDAYNWSKGILYSRVFGAAVRHMWAWWCGQDKDEETGLSHLAHAGCCVLFLLQYEINRRDFDDRPVKEYA